MIVTVGAGIETFVEVSSYIILFHHIWKHDNNLAADVLDQNIIKKRNRVNALSVFGLFVTWVIEVLYVVFIGILSFIVIDHDFVREVVGFCRIYDYFLIPFVQIHTSAPIQAFISSRKSQ